MPWVEMMKKRSNEYRPILAGLMLTFAVSGCSSSIPASKIDPEVAEATFRYQFEHNESGLKTAANVYCIGFSAESADDRMTQDPSPDFLRRLSDVTPPVKAYSQCSRTVGQSVIDQVTGKSGLIFRIGFVKCADASHCEVEGGYYEANESASGNTYYLEKHDNEWVVVKDVMHWIS